MFLSRTLYMSPIDDSIPVKITVNTPIEEEQDWTCCYTIDWPDKPRHFYSAGVDAVQALLGAMEMIGTELYTSVHHRNGKLRWTTPGDGYGFPVPHTIRHLLVGSDAAHAGL